MGCKSQGDLCDNSVLSPNHCYNFSPGEGVTVSFSEYPSNPIRTQNYNVPDRDGNAVMYNSIALTATQGQGGATNPPPSSAGNCGKITKTSPCNGLTTLVYDHIPSGLSFDYVLSDTWFSYLYDTSDDAGNVGTPCYYLTTKTTTTSTSGVPASGEPGDPEYDPGIGATSDTSSETICNPCTAFYCDVASTSLRYSANEDITGDPDCPHPTLFGFGTDTNKLAFRYNALSTTLPDGVVDFELSYDGITWTDVWDQGIEAGVPYETSQNTWQSGDESFSNFEIYELEDIPNNVLDFKIKAYIEPVFDDTGASVVFSGTRWTIAEVMNAGTGYTVGDTFTLEYLYTHPDQTTTNLTVQLRIKTIGPVSTTAGQAGFDVLRAGDTINGHTITRVFHTDLDNFQYHVLYVDESGNSFTKDTQYTSNRNHIITAIAGHGIVDRAILVGKYEFLNKSMQYTVADLNKNAPDIFNTLKQPEFDVTVTNGRISNVTITDGGSGWNLLGNPPVLRVSSPQASNGIRAVVKGIFVNGVLTSIEIEEKGSGYSSSPAPVVYIENVFLTKTELEKNEGYSAEAASNFTNIMKAVPTTESYSPTSEQIQVFENNYNQMPKELKNIKVEPTVRFKPDPERNEVAQIPQYKYSAKAVEKLKEFDEPRYSIEYVETADLDNRLKDWIITSKDEDRQRREHASDIIVQKQIPEYSTADAVYIETVQGSFSELPYSSTYTKYIMRQYRPDPERENSISVNLSCSPVDVGCGHFVCSPPTPPTNTSTSETDPETTNTTTTTVSYVSSPLLGDGCQGWSSSGKIKIFHDLTNAAQTAVAASEAYGNPYL